MGPHIDITMTVGTLRSMTAEQLDALQKNVLADGCWETHKENFRIHGGGDYLGLNLGSPERPKMFLGIEKDGYTHS